MEKPAEPSALQAAFERVVHAIPHETEFRDVEIVMTAAKRNRDGFALSVTVDKDGGVDVAVCERIAARVNAALEAFPEPYTLEVESAGLNRPLVKPADYDRFAGQNVKVLTTLAIGGAKTHRGALVGVRGTNVILTTPAGELPIPLEVVRGANVEYDIRADLSRAKQAKKKAVK
jgi:ribosome maturation factor RimP